VGPENPAGVCWDEGGSIGFFLIFLLLFGSSQKVNKRLLRLDSGFYSMSSPLERRLRAYTIQWTWLAESENICCRPSLWRALQKMPEQIETKKG